MATTRLEKWQQFVEINTRVSPWNILYKIAKNNTKYVVNTELKDNSG